jgi:hypothetical protein
VEMYCSAAAARQVVPLVLFRWHRVGLAVAEQVLC